MLETLAITPLLAAVGQVGFPIVLAGYLLIRFERKIEALTASITELIHAARSKSSESEDSDG
ncbi:YvrJ family protein [Paenibacillus sp. LHD-38]|uniref:YvrJ family protein n=1 Tax=Paenibacillus sp. LHD-38 TaxID=3072143 RepID=UPI00280DDF06|nr:YvrJ family protein [Paenibacillus sp. LHD-38]MDQ8735179.1 YvrJ family protein [Paenibacillus sp. LHD-38]